MEEPLFHRQTYTFPESSADHKMSFDCSRPIASLAEVSEIDPARESSLNGTQQTIQAQFRGLECVRLLEDVGGSLTSLDHPPV